jgi:sugar phosphate isomerase/epimerase
MPKSKSSKIALILYTLRDFAETPAQAARTLKRVRKIGYENIQVSGAQYSAIDPAEMRKMADETGLKIISTHIGLDDFRKNFSGEIDRIHTYGCTYAAIPSFSYGSGTAATWKAFGKECNRIGRRLLKEGIHLQYHNHHFEFQKLGVRGGKGGATRFDILMGSSDPKYLQSELDVAWVARGGYDPAAVFATVKGRVDQVHAKDWGVTENEPVWRAVGEGGLNWKAIVKAGKAAGVKMWIVEQDTCPITNNPFKSIAISYENLMQMAL